MKTDPRTRTVTWEDPARGVLAARSMSGLEFIRAIARGDLPAPPFLRLLGAEMAEVEEGRVLFEVDPGEYHYNPIGSVHGGMTATLCDSAMGCSVHTRLPMGVGWTTLELHVNFIRGITFETGRLTCTGTVLHLGRTIATVEAKVVDAQGRLLVHATCTCLLLRPGGA